jgi:hypothetical protein
MVLALQFWERPMDGSDLRAVEKMNGVVMVSSLWPVAGCRPLSVSSMMVQIKAQITNKKFLGHMNDS